MDQFWTWHYSVANAMRNIMLIGSSEIALGLLDLWIYPDIRFARGQDKHSEKNS